MKTLHYFPATFCAVGMFLSATAAVPLAQAPQDNDKTSPTKKAGEKEPEKKQGRWNIRNGVDEGAKKIAKKAVPSTLTALAKLRRPAVLSNDKRVSPAETTLWTVDAQVVSYDLHDDGDFHVVLKDKAGNTLIAELPDPDEISASPFATEIAAARRVFARRFQPGKGEQKVKGGTAAAAALVRLTGPGYFGRVQKPGLPNGLQIHPITGIAPR